MGGETTEAFDERQRIAAVLRRMGLDLRDYVPGIPPTHRALLLTLADLLDG